MPVRTIFVDAMGGDLGPSVCVEGAIGAVHEATEPMRVALVGVHDELEQTLTQYYHRHKLERHESLEIIDAPDFIRMDESPSEVLRRPQTSIRVAMRLMKEGKGVAVVSTANTGAVMAAGLAELGRLGSVSRPAIAFMFPSENGGCLLLDVGANTLCKTQNLVEFAIMGACYMQAVRGKARPRVGLLSIGEEPTKGTDLIVNTHRALAEGAFDFAFIGNVEGRDVLAGKADVIVCDGFVGNILLKFAESLQGFLTRAVIRQIKSNYFSRAGAILMGPFLRRMKKTFDYAEYGGAPLLGLDGMCLICHGSSNAKAVKNAVWAAASGAEHQVNQHILEALAVCRPVTNGVPANQP